jgi:DNA gyrase inhibitor GyrI
MHELRTRLERHAQSGGNGQNHPQPDICEVGDMDLVYIRIIGQYGETAPYETAWGNLVRFLEDNGALSDATRFIGISFDDPNVTQSQRCRFYACASVQKKIVPAGAFGTVRLRRGKYAVYTLKGSYSGLQELYNSISLYCPFPLRHGMAFEEYLNCPADTETENLLTKVFIPVK